MFRRLNKTENKTEKMEENRRKTNKNFKIWKFGNLEINSTLGNSTRFHYGSQTKARYEGVVESRINSIFLIYFKILFNYIIQYINI